MSESIGRNQKQSAKTHTEEASISPSIARMKKEHCIEMARLEDLRLSSRNARTHPPAQIDQLAASIREFGFLVPIVIDGSGTILAGHGRFEAARKIGLTEVPAIKAGDLSKARRRAFAVADNKIAQNGGWDRKVLAVELPQIADLLVAEDLDIAITGFGSAEIDRISTDPKRSWRDPFDENIGDYLDSKITSRPGDRWKLGSHEILCGDARDQNAIESLMGRRPAALAFLDPAIALGKLDRSKSVVGFLKRTLGVAAAVSGDGAIHFVCTQWRNVGDLIEAGASIYGNMLNLAIWVKSAAAGDSFYRSQHEPVGVFRVGQRQHFGNAPQRRDVPSRSDVWRHRGGDTRIKGMNPCPPIKPIGLIADVIEDATRKDDLIFDSFAGCGTTLLAAEDTGRRVVALENDPRLVDLAIRRWQAFSGKDAVCATRGRSFNKIANDPREKERAEL